MTSDGVRKPGESKPAPRGWHCPICRQHIFDRDVLPAYQRVAHLVVGHGWGLARNERDEGGRVSAIEFRGGPWDGDYRGWDETQNDVLILLDDMRVMGRHNQVRLDECPRIGRYAFVCGMDLDAEALQFTGYVHYEWMGEQ